MTGFVLRAPWYVRERAGTGLLGGCSTRPAIQMYDSTDFVRRLLADPRDSLRFTDADRWSYPVPVTPSASAHGRARLATSRLVTTRMRKLYQPSHNRFYVVVVEVFCDRPGLPRAGSHDEIKVGFVMRRHRTSVTGAPRPTRRLARNLLVELARQQDVAMRDDPLPEDVRDVWWAEEAWRQRFAADNADLLTQLTVDTANEGWFLRPTGPSTGPTWKRPADAEPGEVEETFPMWRLPARPEDCPAAGTRSTWFGVVPTYSSEHFSRAGQPRPKLDDRAIYELRCFVSVPPPSGHEHCPPRVYWGSASEPFRLASPMDPQGTSQRTTSITLPDLRRLAARAGQPMGPGGVRINTPPQSQLVFNPFKGIPKSGSGAIGAGGGVCTFALELFFLVAFFLFLMFLPIVVFAFQLWWMLALRFCFPPSVAFGAMADFFAEGKLLADLQADAGLTAEFDLQFGTQTSLLTAGDASEGWAFQLEKAVDDGGTPVFANDANFVGALLVGTDPRTAVPPSEPEHESLPDDPLCPPSR